MEGFSYDLRQYHFNERQNKEYRAVVIQDSETGLSQE
jgi:hypothetical protein